MKSSNELASIVETRPISTMDGMSIDKSPCLGVSLGQSSSSHIIGGMCGRFAAFSSATAVADRLALQTLTDGARLLPPNWNVAPTNEIKVVTESALETGRWGMLSSWSQNNTGLINARAETVATKPAFAQAFAKRRCIVPVDGYYEWHKVHSGKQPYFITDTTSDESPMLFFAGIFNYSPLADPETGELYDDPVKTISLITTTASDSVSQIHHRMPVSFTGDQIEQWLMGNSHDAEQLLHHSQKEFANWPVSKQVNYVRNNGAELVEPITDPADPNLKLANTLNPESHPTFDLFQ
ncbi:MAG: SOS response-associated peptidase [Promicromonosporaceae bacterium]|nr:SOS response-associated peptidase [Promicromonosporaceae bacterium]